ncbi:MAG: response regulator [Planctomycetota bacterium]|nr:MAG: response regulator [Planctomycetota bacterium]
MALILVIDDEEESRELVKETLEIGGHLVKEAPSWLEGNQIIIRERPELVLLDVHMPGLQGPQILEVLRETLKKPPKFIFYSAMDIDQLQKMTLEYGANGFIQKGVSLSELLNRVEFFLK